MAYLLDQGRLHRPMMHPPWQDCPCHPEPQTFEEKQQRFLAHIRTRHPKERWALVPGALLVYDLDLYPNGPDDYSFIIGT